MRSRNWVDDLHGSGNRSLRRIYCNYMNTKITRIGNSRGIRIPKVLLELYGFEEEDQVDLTETREGILISRSLAEPAKKLPWKEAYAEMAQDVAERAEWIEWDAAAGDGVGAVSWDPAGDT